MKPPTGRVGGIDVLAHLAGILKGSGLEVPDVDKSIWDPVIKVNLKGSYISLSDPLKGRVRACPILDTGQEVKRWYNVTAD